MGFEKDDFEIPRKRIHVPVNMEVWFQSEAYTRIVAFILQLSSSVRGLRVSDCSSKTENIGRVCALLEHLDGLVSSIPPVEKSARFGNPAFRTFHKTITQTSDDMLARFVLPEGMEAASAELGPYLVGSFGNESRIDYGTGHELSFVAFLYVLVDIEFLAPSEFPAIVLHVFLRYLNLVRRLQQVYRMEPAGSHGVWGLDDYQFLPFLFGSSQLIDHPSLLPSAIHSDRVLREHSDEFMYFSAIQYIRKVKTGPFFEHSSMLNDVSRIHAWSKHFLFGSRLRFSVPVENDE